MADLKKDDDYARHSHEENVFQEDDIESQSGSDMPAILRQLTTEEYKKVGSRATLKMDIIILPCLMMMYVLNYLDRNNIASAKLANITEDLHLTSTEYQSCISILFVGYILMQVPSNMMLGKVKWPGVYICVAMGVWGVISAAQTVVHNFAGLAIARFFIGLVEAVFFPGSVFYLSLFYNRKQYAFRAALFVSGSQLGNAFGGLLAIAILQLNGKYGLAGWRWLFLIEGVVTIGLAIIFALILPNSPKDVKGFTRVEKAWVIWTYEQDQGQSDNRSEITATQGLFLALKDAKTWLLLTTVYADFTSAGVTNFFPAVVSTLGYNRTITLALTAPPFVLCCIAMLAVGFHSDRIGERYWHIVLPLIITLVANIIAVSTLNTAARYTAIMLMPPSFYAAYTVLLSWITGSLSQPVAKRASAIALIISACNTANIWTPYLYSGAPRYSVAFTVNLVAAAAAIVIATITRFYLRRENRKLDDGEEVGKSGPTRAQIASGFRYQL
ncbi:hypothetical protein diail_8068 [Diaporthe ilicicola]|nr:hypothetical protein diail_8068 [Diaporthe ilicicola]